MRSPRRLPPLLVAGALVLGALGAGCTNLTPPALVVNGHTVSQQDLLEQAALVAKIPQGGAVLTRDKTTFATTDVVGLLNEYLYAFLIADEVAERKITITAADRSAAEEELAGQLQGGDIGALRPVLVEARAGQAALTRDLGRAAFESGAVDETQLRAMYEQVKTQQTNPAQVCLHLVLALAVEIDRDTGRPLAAPTDADYERALAEATDAKLRLDGGAAFEEVSSALSDVDGETQGGDVGCIPESRLTGPLAALLTQPVGVASDPVRADEGYYVFRVDRREAPSSPSFEQLRPQLEESLAAQAGEQAIRSVLNERAKDPGTKVSVDPRFGRWDAALASVVPPDGAAKPTVPTAPTSSTPPLTLSPDPAAGGSRGAPGGA